jgi:alpha-L-fucosidase
MPSISRRHFIATTSLATGSLLLGESRTTAPSPYGAVPSARQLAWHRLETTAFLHFSVNTFTDKEWGYGDEDPNVFNPTEFDADAMIRDLKAGGMKGAILTCKHHDGFCLWPTKTTEHCIRNSRWRGGKGDVVRDLSDAARKAGMKFGVYVSPWDRANPKYATPEYLPIYREQVRELLTNYGSIFEVWFDGANGGDGYYGGAREKRTIPRDYYEWDKTIAMIRELQPEAVIFGAEGDIRWVGNESGVAGDPCWSTYRAPLHGMQDAHASAGGSKDELMTGVRNGAIWKPAECDVSIRPGWFWHASQNEKVKTPEALMDLYFKSVGRGASLLLNIPPNDKGLIETGDAASLLEFHRRREQIFAKNLAVSARLRASNVRGSSRQFGAQNLVDGNERTFWATDDSQTTPNLIFEWKEPQQVAIVRLREAIQLGQRIAGFGVDIWQDGGWKEIVTGTSIGACRLLQLPQTVSTSKMRLRITESPACVVLTELGVFGSAA